MHFLVRRGVRARRSSSSSQRPLIAKELWALEVELPHTQIIWSLHLVVEARQRFCARGRSSRLLGAGAAVHFMYSLDLQPGQNQPTFTLGYAVATAAA